MLHILCKGSIYDSLDRATFCSCLPADARSVSGVPGGGMVFLKSTSGGVGTWLLLLAASLPP